MQRQEISWKHLLKKMTKKKYLAKMKNRRIERKKNKEISQNQRDKKIRGLSPGCPIPAQQGHKKELTEETKLINNARKFLRAKECKFPE